MLSNCGAGEDSWESLGQQESKSVNPKGNQSWIFIGSTDAEAETPILWPPDAKNWHTGKDSDAGKDWRQEEKGTTEDKMAGWHYQPDRREFEWTLEVGDGQGSLAAAVHGVAKSWTQLSDCELSIIITDWKKEVTKEYVQYDSIYIKFKIGKTNNTKEN